VGRREQPGSVQEDCFFPCMMTPFSPRATPPRLRTGESMHLLCFWPSPTSRARRERQQGASGVDGGSEGTARFCAGGVLFPCNIINDPNFASCDTAPRLRTDESMHLVCFWPSPTSRARRERQRGASGVRWWVGTARFCAGGLLFPCKMTPYSPHATPPRLRTGESMYLVCFWPSPTSRARRERQRGASGVRWWVGENSPVLCRRIAFPRVK
jgi:hypothetical protein